MSLRYKGGLISPSVNPLAANVTASPNVAQYNGVFTLQQQAQALTAGQWANDPYFKNNILLLHGDGKANGSQNNTFLDSSTNNFTITRNGNTTQGAATPYGPAWSVYMAGGEYLSIPSASYTSLPYNSSWTIETWFNTTTATSVLFNNYINSGTYYGIILSLSTNGVIDTWDGTSHRTSAITGLNDGNWHHVAWVNNAGTSTVYVDGVATAMGGSASWSTPASSTRQTAWYVGFQDGGNSLVGYVSNLRVVNGTAVYTGNFTPSTKPLTAITNTSFLTCQSNRFIDNSTNAAVVSIGAGSPKVQRFNPFPAQYQYTPAVIGGAAYFDGSGDYLTSPSSSAFSFGTGDFTAECWVNHSVFGAGADQGIFQISTTSGGFQTTNSNTIALASYNSAGKGFRIYANATTGESGIIASTGTWYHLAVVRSSGTTKLYVNGALGATVASDTTNYTGTYLGIGGYYSTSYLLNGYMTDLRVVKGTAVYTGTFTPPTAPLATSGAASAASYPSTTNVNTSFASSATSLLCSMTNGGILDNAMISNMETVGNAQISTATAKYGSGSLYFDGNGDWLTFPSDVNSNFAFRTGDFTIEFWAWKPANGVGGYDGVIGADNNGNASGGFAVELSSNRGFVFYNDGFARITYAMNPNDSTWHHYAVVRASGVMALYKDGQQLTTAAYTGDLGATPTLRVGSLSTTSNFNGYLDDLRVTKGVARYTGNFVPPQVSLANQ